MKSHFGEQYKIFEVKLLALINGNIFTSNNTVRSIFIGIWKFVKM